MSVGEALPGGLGSGSARIERWVRVGGRFLGAALLVAAWELTVRAGWADPYLLPAPSAVAVKIVQEASEGELMRHAALTVYRGVTGFLIAAALGVALGTLAARNAFCRWLIDPLVSVGFPAPKIALLPIFILWFGLGDASKLTMIVITCIFPVISATCLATSSIDRYLLWSAQNLGVGPRALLWEVVLPAALPQVLTSLQIALPIAFITVIVAEMLTGGGGLGGSMMESTRLADPAGAFANLIVIGILGYAAMKALQWARGRILVWHEEVQRQGDVL